MSANERTNEAGNERADRSLSIGSSKASVGADERAAQQQDPIFVTTSPTGVSKNPDAPSVMIALCLLGDKDFLGGNGVRAMARPAPQRQLE
jgi:hypothetical protein